MAEGVEYIPFKVFKNTHLLNTFKKKPDFLKKSGF
jgi:hypothetical protein